MKNIPRRPVDANPFVAESTIRLHSDHEVRRTKKRDPFAESMKTRKDWTVRAFAASSADEFAAEEHFQIARKMEVGERKSEELSDCTMTPDATGGEDEID